MPIGHIRKGVSSFLPTRSFVDRTEKPSRGSLRMRSLSTPFIFHLVYYLSVVLILLLCLRMSASPLNLSMNNLYNTYSEFDSPAKSASEGPSTRSSSPPLSFILLFLSWVYIVFFLAARWMVMKLVMLLSMSHRFQRALESPMSNSITLWTNSSKLERTTLICAIDARSSMRPLLLRVPIERFCNYVCA